MLPDEAREENARNFGRIADALEMRNKIELVRLRIEVLRQRSVRVGTQGFVFGSQITEALDEAQKLIDGGEAATDPAADPDPE